MPYSLIPIHLPATVEEKIKGAENCSDTLMKRVRVHFTNGYALSIIRGEYSYGGPAGYFEIAPVNRKGELDGRLFDEEDQGDDVLGWVDEARLLYYLNKLANLA